MAAPDDHFGASPYGFVVSAGGGVGSVTIEDIYKTKLDFALIARKGGGCGTTLSNIRPKGDIVGALETLSDSGSLNIISNLPHNSIFYELN